MRTTELKSAIEARMLAQDQRDKADGTEAALIDIGKKIDKAISEGSYSAYIEIPCSRLPDENGFYCPLETSIVARLEEMGYSTGPIISGGARVTW